ncbi:MAG: hypothetical protein U0168_12365 [Nannocystaceae bacterium]
MMMSARPSPLTSPAPLTEMPARSWAAPGSSAKPPKPAATSASWIRTGATYTVTVADAADPDASSTNT